MTVKQGRSKVREVFESNRGVKDIRVIDMLVVKVWFGKFDPYLFVILKNIFLLHLLFRKKVLLKQQSKLV